MSKFKFLIGTLVVAGFAFASVASAACSDLAPARVGSRGANVMEIQKIVGATADGAFGPMTAAAVKAFQASNGLVADGIVGAKSIAVMAAKCSATTTTPVVTTPVTTTVSGGAGDLSIDTTSKDVEGDVKEESEENVLGYKVEAEDSDISITNVKIELSNHADDSTSERLTNYIDEVKVYLGDEEVGSVDADEFSKTSGNPDTFTKSISLSGAVVSEGDVEYLYVAVVAGSIDTEDEGATWDLEMTSMSYTDGTGAIMSADTDDIATIANFGFDPETADDDLNIKTSSANPSASTIGVDNDDETEDVLIGAFKFEVPEDSSDISILELPIAVEFAANGSTDDDFAEDVITELYVTIDGEDYEADLDDDDDDTENGSGTATYYVSFEDDEMVIDADDTVEVKIYATFAAMDDGEVYAEGTTVKATVTGADVEAEGADEMSATGTSFTGKIHTLSAVDLDVKKVSAPTPTYIGDTTTTVEYITKIKIVNDGEEDVYIPTDALDNYFIMENTSSVLYEGGTPSISLESTDSSIEDADGGYFTIGADSEEEFTVTVVLDNTGGTSGTYRVSMDEIDYSTDSDLNPEAQLTFTAVKSASKYASAS